MKKAKKFDIVNIKDLKGHKVLAELTKPRSPLSKMVIIEKGEDWFVEVYTFKTKTGIVTGQNTITMKQVEDWIDRFQTISGYKLK